MTKLIAFHGEQSVKDKYLRRIAEHRAVDELVRGATGKDGKGCAVWCTLDKYEHRAYETELGIPQSLARIEDALFESLPIDYAMQWPSEFLLAISIGADLSMVADKFLHWLLVDPVDGVIRFAKTERSMEAISDVGNLYARKISGEKIPTVDWRAAYATTVAAAYATDVAAAYATDAAAYATVAARGTARLRQADKLLELLRDAPVRRMNGKTA